MGQVEEQRYVCRICSKSCVSGKSLGGHMRVHLAQIAASKKAAVIKMECDDDHRLEETCINQSNSVVVEEFGDGDQSKHALTAKTANSCRECGKEFASLRALSGHMRCHSIKNKKEVHLCKECGRSFESMRALFGHMKCHSKRVSSVVESGESLSDLENFCPIRRKRSRIKYKGTVNPSFSGVGASHCGVYELEDEEEAARSLVMISRGVGSFLKFDSSAEDYDDSVYFGGVVASCGSDGEVVANASFVGKKGPQFDVKFDDAEMLRVEKGMKSDLDLVCDDEFLKDGIGSNGGDDESCFENKSCENGADLEMVEGFEEKQQMQHTLGSLNERRKMVGTSSDLHTINDRFDIKHDQCGGEEDRVEQGMESGSARGSLRGAKSMRRCCSLLEMDAVAVIW